MKRLVITNDGAVIYNPSDPPCKLSLLERWINDQEPLGYPEFCRIPDWAFALTDPDNPEDFEPKSPAIKI